MARTDFDWHALAKAAAALERGEPLQPEAQEAVNRAFVKAWQAGGLKPAPTQGRRRPGRPKVRVDSDSAIVAAFQALMDAGGVPYAVSKVIGRQFNVSPKTAHRRWQRGRAWKFRKLTVFRPGFDLERFRSGYEFIKRFDSDFRLDGLFPGSGPSKSTPETDNN